MNRRNQYSHEPVHHRSSDSPRYHDRYYSERENNRRDDYDFDHDERSSRGRDHDHRDTYMTGRDYARASYEGHDNYGNGYNAGSYEDDNRYYQRDRDNYRSDYRSERDNGYANDYRNGSENYRHNQYRNDRDDYRSGDIDNNHRNWRGDDREYSDRDREEYYRKTRNDYNQEMDYGMHNSQRYRSVPEHRRRRNDEPYSDNWSNAYTPMSKY